MSFQTSAVESGNMGVLSDFSDQASTSSVSTPIAPEILVSPLICNCLASLPRLSPACSI